MMMTSQFQRKSLEIKHHTEASCRRIEKMFRDHAVLWSPIVIAEIERHYPTIQFRAKTPASPISIHYNATPPHELTTLIMDLDFYLRSPYIPTINICSRLDNYNNAEKSPLHLMYHHARMLIDDMKNIEANHGLFISGKKGTGKTHLAIGLAKELIHRGFNAHFISKSTSSEALTQAMQSEPQKTVWILDNLNDPNDVFFNAILQKLIMKIQQQQAGTLIVTSDCTDSNLTFKLSDNASPMLDCDQLSEEANKLFNTTHIQFVRETKNVVEACEEEVVAQKPPVGFNFHQECVSDSMYLNDFTDLSMVTSGEPHDVSANLSQLDDLIEIEEQAARTTIQVATRTSHQSSVLSDVDVMPFKTEERRLHNISGVTSKKETPQASTINANELSVPQKTKSPKKNRVQFHNKAQRITFFVGTTEQESATDEDVRFDERVSRIKKMQKDCLPKGILGGDGEGMDSLKSYILNVDTTPDFTKELQKRYYDSLGFPRLLYSALESILAEKTQSIGNDFLKRFMLKLIPTYKTQTKWIDVAVALRQHFNLSWETVQNETGEYKILNVAAEKKRFSAIRGGKTYTFAYDDASESMQYTQPVDVGEKVPLLDELKLFEDAACTHKILIKGMSSFIMRTVFYYQTDNQTYALKWLPRGGIGIPDGSIRIEFSGNNIDTTELFEVKVIRRVDKLVSTAATVSVPSLFDALIKEFVQHVNIDSLILTSIFLIEQGYYEEATHMATLMCRKIPLYFNTPDAKEGEGFEHSGNPSQLAPIIQTLFHKGLLKSAQAIIHATKELGRSKEIDDLEKKLIGASSNSLFFGNCQKYATKVLNITDDMELQLFISNECDVSQGGPAR